MNPHTRKAVEAESVYVAGAESNFMQARGRQFRGTIWQTARFDEGMAVREELARRGLFDPDLLARLPQNRRVVMRGYERRWWWFGKRATGVVIASVLAPPGAYIAGESADSPAPPVGLADLLEHVRRIAPTTDVPHVIGVCSPSGFTDEVRHSHLDLPNVTLVVVEPRADGGWAVTPLSDAADEAICRLFDPDTTARKIERVRQEIEARRADLLTGGLSAGDLAGRMGLPTELVAQAFRQAATADPELQASESGRDVLLFRGVAATEDQAMSVVDRIRQLFGMAGNEARKINLLTERRAKLAQRRDRLYEDIAKLEQRERDLLEQGRQNKSEVVRRRVASQLAQHRRDMSRLNTTANMLNQQINVISTHIHNLTLIQQGQMAQLPATEELTQDAVRAEEMLEQLKADVDLVSTLDTGISNVLATQDELDILKEFEEADRAEQQKAEAAKATPEPKQAAPQAESPSKQRERGTPEAG